MNPSIILEQEKDTLKLGRKIAELLPKKYCGWMILLEGELGVGKTTLARAILGEFGHKGAVPSPTYTLVEPYDFPDGIIYHIDLYRVISLNEIEFLGWSDLYSGLMIIEWAEKFPALVNEADILIKLNYYSHGRACQLISISKRGSEILKSFKHDFFDLK